MGAANRELGPRLKAAVAASAELQERDALKHVGLAAAMTTALLARDIPDSTARLASEMGVLAFKQGHARWSENDQYASDDLAPHAVTALDELRAAIATLNAGPVDGEWGSLPGGTPHAGQRSGTRPL